MVEVIIIGGGTAGLFCGATFSLGVNGLILEKTGRPGTKLLMSGSGQCNITHGGSIKDFVSHYGEKGSKIRGILYKHNNRELCKFLEGNGIPTIEREDGKVFPASLKSRDILDMLLNKCKQNGFAISHNEEVRNISKEDGIFKVTTKSDCYLAKKVVVATGGCSYPTTGSDGSMLRILKDSFDLNVIPPKPSLVPIFVENYPYTEASGISFGNIGVSVFRGSKKIASEVGDVLLTHQNLSGPAILNISRYVINGDKIVLNYLYPGSFEETFARLRTVTSGNKKSLDNIVSGEFNLPKKFVQILVRESGEQLKTLAQNLWGQSFTVSGVAGYKEAMCTSGGISLDEINLKTMECKKVPGLHLIGEVVDIDGDTGGYNLQFAYSSACASNAAK